MTYVYDRAECTGLGDRVGILMTLATLANLHDVQIAFEWCQDPSQVFPRLHKHIPQWKGYDYDMPEFIGRFWPHHDKLTIIADNFTSHQRESSEKSCCACRGWAAPCLYYSMESHTDTRQTSVRR